MAKTVALGTVLRVEDPDNAGQFITVGNLTSIPVPGPTKQRIDVTDFDSEAMEYLPGLPDNEELALSGFFNYEDAGQAVLLADAHDPLAPVRSFQIEFTRQDVQFTFNAYTASFTPNAGGPNEAYGFDAALQITGAVTTTSPIPA